MAPTPDDAPVQPPPFVIGYASVPRIPLDRESRHVLPDHFLRAAHRRDRVWLHVLLFLATLLTTTLVGMELWASHEFMANRMRTDTPIWSLVPGGLAYSVAIMAILGAHEMGHYLACVYYRVDASLPFFLPVPPPFIAGTLGAFIRIRQRIQTKKQVFDIGIAGPLAGFAVTVPVLFIGLALSTIVPAPTNLTVREYADPLLFTIANWLVFGPVRDGMMVNAHPMVFAAWFGCLATALNLFPVGQLDGGHLSYAVLGRHSTKVSFVALAVGVVLSFFSPSWIVWTILMAAMLKVFGTRHPSSRDEDVPVGRGRVALALLAIAILVLCFMPKPLDEVVLGR